MNFSKLQKNYYWHSVQFCSLQPNGQFWAENLLIEWNFSKFSSFLLPATCLEWIGSVSFTQKNEFYRVKIEQIFATESWFDGKNSQNSNIVALKRWSRFRRIFHRTWLWIYLASWLISRNFCIFTKNSVKSTVFLVVLILALFW